jgi:hypothetical protein
METKIEAPEPGLGLCMAEITWYSPRRPCLQSQTAASFLCRHQVSIQWFSVVPRKDMEPRDEFSRHQLLVNGLKWSRETTTRQRGEAGAGVLIRRNHELHTSTNIFRREWTLSPTYSPPKQKLHRTSGTSWNEFPKPFDEVLVEIGDDNASVDSPSPGDDSAPEDTNIVAWEERVTFCWGNYSHGRCRKLNARCQLPKPRDCTQTRVFSVYEQLRLRLNKFMARLENDADMQPSHLLF